MRIMTLNIWGVYFGNPAGERIDAIEDTLRKYSADIFGLQEFCSGWRESGLIDRLSNKYAAVCFEKDYTPLFFLKDTFNLKDSGHFLYNNTPDESKGFTWAVLEEKATGKMLGVFNTHLWWKTGDEHEIIREQNAMELLASMKEIKEKYNDVPVFAFGDFNSPEDKKAIKYLENNGVITSYKIADKFSPNSSHHGDPIRDEKGIYRGKITDVPKERSLDHIVTFIDDVKIIEQKVVEDQTILDATDHSPVYIDFSL